MMHGRQFGKYSIVSTLGKGTRGTVYLADDNNGNQVALKIISQEFFKQFSTEKIRELYFQQIKNASTVVHPNIVRIFDSGEKEGTPFLACELVTGGSLAEIIKSCAPLSESHAIEIIRQLLSALVEIHKSGLIHRNIKTTNMLLDKFGNFKLSDLGMVLSTESQRTGLTQPERDLEVPFYIAPEEIHGECELDFRCDLYSSGVVFYECLCGQPPFVGRFTEVFHQHLYKKVPEIKAPEIRPQVADLVMKLLSKRPDDRPTNAGEVLQQLNSLHSKMETSLITWNKTSIHSSPQKSPSIDWAANSKSTSLTTERDSFSSSTTESGVHCQETPQVVELTCDESTSLPALARAKLVVTTEKSTNTHFIYAGDALQFGRNAIGEEQGICLRLRPAKGSEAHILRISGKHFRIFIRKEKAYIQDVGSRGGTKVDGKLLAAQTHREILAKHRVKVADVIDLSISKVSKQLPSYEIVGIGTLEANLPAVFISRPTNGIEHSYSLVPGKLKLGIDDRGALAPSSKGTLEVFCIDNSLWARGGKIPEGKCRPLYEGLEFVVASHKISVCKIYPQDQK